MDKLDVQKARAAQRAYAKAWRAKNPDKVREANVRYWLRRAEREAIKTEQKEEPHDDNA